MEQEFEQDNWIEIAKENFKQCSYALHQENDYLLNEMWQQNSELIKDGYIGIFQESKVKINQDYSSLLAVIWIKKEHLRTKKAFKEYTDPKAKLKEHIESFPQNADILTDKTKYSFNLCAWSCLPLDLFQRLKDTDIRDITQQDFAQIRKCYGLIIARKTATTRKRRTQGKINESKNFFLPKRYIETRSATAPGKFTGLSFLSKNTNASKERIPEMWEKLKTGDERAYKDRSGNLIERRTYFDLGEYGHIYEEILDYIYKERRKELEDYITKTKDENNRFFNVGINIEEYCKYQSNDGRVRQRDCDNLVKVLVAFSQRWGFIIEKKDGEIKKIAFTQMMTLNLVKDLQDDSFTAYIGIPDLFVIDFFSRYVVFSREWLKQIPTSKCSQLFKIDFWNEQYQRIKKFKKIKNKDLLIVRQTWKDFVCKMDGKNPMERKQDRFDMRKEIDKMIEITMREGMIVKGGTDKDGYWYEINPDYKAPEQK